MIDTDHVLQLYLSGTSPTIVAARQTMQRALGWRTTSTPPPLIIEGETCIGKSLLAWWLHRNSVRAEKPFVRIYFPSTPPYAQIYTSSPNPRSEPKTEIF